MAPPLITQPIAIFLVVMALIVAVPAILGRWKIPNVIGLIVAGVALGPYGFNILARDMSFEVFGGVGLLYLMFLAGIEIDMHSLRRNIVRGAVFGILTFAVPLTLGYLTGRYLFGMDMACGLLLGAMFSAHTLIAYPIVTRFDLTRQPSVIVAVSGTIVAVLGSLVVLAGVTSGLGAGTPALQLIKLLIYLAAFCGAVVYVYPRFTRWFFKHYSDGILQFAWVLALVFLAAYVAQCIGIEGVFGAFFAGIVLNRYIPGRSVLMRRLEFVGNAIFIPYFLIGVGMYINIRVIARGWDTLYVASIMIAVAMIAKWLAAWLTQKLFRYSSLERSLMFQLSNAHTAVALAVVMIGYSSGLFGEEVLNGTVLMILVTCSVSSLGVERAAAKLRLKLLKHSEPVLKEVSHNDRILVTVANPITVPALVEMALFMSRQGYNRSELMAVHVRSDASNAAKEVGRTALDLAEKTAHAAEHEITTFERFDLNISAGLLNAATERDASSIIIGLHRKGGIIDSFFGDMIEQLVLGTSRMIVVSRCYIPVSTITRLVIAVPPKAEHESGFVMWVESVGNLARELGCRAIFCCHPLTQRAIKAVFRLGKISIRVEFNQLLTYDDFTLLPEVVIDDDLFIVVSARRASISYNEYMEPMPSFLDKYFSRNNLMVIYPSQSGSDQPLTFTGAMNTGLTTSPSQIWTMVSDRIRAFKRLIRIRRRKG